MTDLSQDDQTIDVACYSDVLCVWAYVAQIRMDELSAVFADQIQVHQHFINLFGDTAHRIGEGWGDRGGYDGFGAHVSEVCAGFEQLQLHADVWRRCRPTGSGNAHLMLKAAQLLEREAGAPAGAADALAWNIRLAFFRDARDISDWQVLQSLAAKDGIAIADTDRLLKNGRAMAALSRDQELRTQHQIAGSPTYVLNNGRQKLFGNVGYRILEANVRELLVHPENQASWC